MKGFVTVLILLISFLVTAAEYTVPPEYASGVAQRGVARKLLVEAMKDGKECLSLQDDKSFSLM